MSKTIRIAVATELSWPLKRHYGILAGIQEYAETQDNWVVEVKLGEVCMSAHWRARNQDSPAEWAWCTQESEQAFSAACLLVGKRVRKGLIIEGSAEQGRVPRTQH